MVSKGFCRYNLLLKCIGDDCDYCKLSPAYRMGMESGIAIKAAKDLQDFCNSTECYRCPFASDVWRECRCSISDSAPCGWEL